MTNFERFITENPEHELVVRLMAISDRMTINNSFGKLFSQICALADSEYGPCPSLERMRQEVAA